MRAKSASFTDLLHLTSNSHTEVRDRLNSPIADARYRGLALAQFTHLSPPFRSFGSIAQGGVDSAQDLLDCAYVTAL